MNMSSNYKPQNYNSVSPYLIVEGAEATIRFLVNAFDAVELRRFPGDSGKLMHAEVRLDDTVIMLADAAEGWPAIPSHVHIYVPDVDTTYQRALAAEATSVQEPVKKEDDDKRGGVKDAGGITWWIATKVV
jgi:PhnB protein